MVELHRCHCRVTELCCVLWAAAITLVAGCQSEVFGTLAPRDLSTEQGSQQPGGAEDPGATGPDGQEPVVEGNPPLAGLDPGEDLPLRTCEGVPLSCRSPIQTADALPGRVLPPVQTRISETISLQRIFEQFDTACGRCHAPPEVPGEKNGNWVVEGVNGMLADLTIWDEAIERIESPDPEVAMPPTRDPSKPLPESLRELHDTLDEWTTANRAATGFVRQKDVSAETPYRYDSAFRDNMSNLGNCIPAPEMIGCAGAEVRSLDQKFARVKSFEDLPKHLDETDLFTLDSAQLAQQRVISYAPTYTLFSDNAKKMRYVRVPEGQVISYDAATREMNIPENTRFYKTFLRHIVDREGRSSYRKIETRIIISRKDIVENGVPRPNAVFGTYLWSLDEARAELVELPYNDQTPFRDLPLRHVIDEQRALAGSAAADASAGVGIDPDSLDGIAAAFEHDEQLRREHPLDTPDPQELLTRGYAVPGRDRCIQCHMGSSSNSFILGFNQYQVERRKDAEGGVFDAPAKQDELTQLQRLIDYGVIVDATPPGPDQVRHRLEESQGERQARNDFELKAQGYMMGNCVFCHNPTGFPSVENPVLKDVMNFFPRNDVGGIFQFSLETFSPRTSRTPAFNVRFPYITPSLFERINALTNLDESERGYILPKAFQLAGQSVFVTAPWRSLIYRNTQTPFTYAHDEAIHPHMPLNVPGYDERTSRILGDWMVSIPARLKNAKETSSGKAAENRTEYLEEDQPWVEVTPGDVNYPYEAYAEIAGLRREAFNSPRIIGVDEFSGLCQEIAARYGVPELVRDCVDSHTASAGYLGGASIIPDTADVVAFEMRGDKPRDQPLDQQLLITPGDPAVLTRNPAQPGVLARWNDGIPDRPSWVLRDLTSIPGRWSPRGSRWDTALRSVDEFVPPAPDLSELSLADRAPIQEQYEIRRRASTRVFHLQEHFSVSPELHRFALEDRPYGLWRAPAGGKTAAGAEARCQEVIPAAPSVADFAADPPLWFAEEKLDPSQADDRDRPVYTQPPGETLFGLICSNCHGKAADGNSLLANTILELTGGRTRVANLHDGIFGENGANRAAVFPDETYAVRYLLWMGLGGTQATIPSVVLNRVGATRPLDVDRKENPNAQATANMLDNAIGFCKDSIGLGIGFDHDSFGLVEFDAKRKFGRESSLVAANGDAELWVRLCGLDNPGPIRAIRFAKLPEDYPSFTIASAYWRDLDGHAQLANDARIGDHRGRIQSGLKPDNLLPWCVLKPEEGDLGELLAAWHERRGRADEEPPWCPESLLVGAGSGPNLFRVLEVAPLNLPDERRDTWATRGAMNVGASVFTYLDALSRGAIKAKPSFDACALPAHR